VKPFFIYFLPIVPCAPFTILATVAVVLIPALFGLATVVAAPPSKSKKANVPVSKSNGSVGPVTTGGVVLVV
jgi:hypothetical protein